MRARPRVAAFLVMQAVLGAATTARAEHESQEMHRLAEEGRRLFDDGQYPEAVALLREGYDRFHEPIFLQYIGRCYQEMDDPCQAAEFYQRFLDEGEPSPQVRSGIEARLDVLDDVCRAESRPPPVEPEEPQGPPPEGPPRTFGVDPEPEPPSHRSTDVAGSVILGLGGVTAVVAAVLWWLSYNDMQSRDDICPYQIRDEESGTYCPMEPEAVSLNPERVAAWEDLERSRDRRGVAGDVMMFGVGPTLIVVGALVLGLGRRTTRSHVALAPGPAGGFSLSVVWQ